MVMGLGMPENVCCMARGYPLASLRAIAIHATAPNRITPTTWPSQPRCPIGPTAPSTHIPYPGAATLLPRFAAPPHRSYLPHTLCDRSATTLARPLPAPLYGHHRPPHMATAGVLAGPPMSTFSGPLRSHGPAYMGTLPCANYKIFLFLNKIVTEFG